MSSLFSKLSRGLLSFALLLPSSGCVEDPLNGSFDPSSEEAIPATPPYVEMLTSSNKTTTSGGAAVQITVTQGQEPYIYSIDSGSGTIDNDGLLTPGTTIETIIVRVTDQTGEYKPRKWK